MRILLSIFLLLPLTLSAQDLLFELEPGAFPVEIEGWQMMQPWAGGMDATTPELCDIDADGDLDYFCGDNMGYVCFFRNTGSIELADYSYESSFFDSLTHPNATYNGAPTRFIDIDNDNDLDAFTAGSYISVYINNGSMFLPQFDLHEDSLRDNNSETIIGTYIDIVDIDNDGDYDLFAGHYSGYLKYYENIGTGTFYSFNLESENWFNTYCSEGFASPCFKDLDNDGDFDLIIGNGEGTLYYYRNDGTSTAPQMTLVSDNYLDLDVGDDASPELADIDGDGDLDLFVGRSVSSAFYFLQGDVFFLENTGSAQSPDFQLVTTNYMSLDIGDGATPRMVDIDADGDPDLLSRKGSNLLLYRNAGNWNEPQFFYENDNFCNISLNTIMPWFCDLDADGDYDLLAGEGAIPGPPGLHYYINRGTPVEPDYVLYSDDLVPGVFNQNSTLLIPGTADIDADGDQDLFVSDANGSFHFFENTGSVTNFEFEYITDNWQNIFDGWYSHRYFCFYDIDHDQDLDLFYNSSSMWYEPWDKNLRFYRNLGTPQNANIVLEIDDMFPELMIHQAAPYLIDIDEDGDGDLFVGDTYGGIRFFRNQEFSAVGSRQSAVSVSFSLLPAYPNPFNNSTTITFTLDRAGKVELQIFDVLGREIGAFLQTPLQSGWYPAGSHEVVWNAEGMASGVYLVRLTVEGMTDRNVCPTRKAVLVK